MSEYNREACMMKRAWPTGGLLSHAGKNINEILIDVAEAS